MPCIAYRDKNFTPKSLDLIARACGILEEFAADGLKVTLRQLYYQFVARDLLPNKQTAYKNLGSLISDARECGKLDWSLIEDRTRELLTRSSWHSPESIVAACASSYARDKWATQPVRIEVWVEKQALIGVIDRASERLNVPCFACKGYVSKSEIWAAGRRVLHNAKNGQKTVILHLGDHDPSGIDMTRDIREQVQNFARPTDTDGVSEVGLDLIDDLIIERIALNMDQIEEFDPPPNPAKTTDSRATGYIEEYGTSSWELDALNPRTLDRLITEAVGDYRDEEAWDEAVEREHREQRLLQECSDRWGEVIDFLDEE